MTPACVAQEVLKHTVAPVENLEHLAIPVRFKPGLVALTSERDCFTQILRLQSGDWLPGSDWLRFTSLEAPRLHGPRQGGNDASLVERPGFRPTVGLKSPEELGEQLVDSVLQLGFSSIPFRHVAQGL